MADRMSMQELAEAFERLVDLPPAHRCARLAAETPNLADRARLERMMVADDREALRFLDAPALIHAQVLQDDQPAAPEPGLLIGQQFGAFRIERLIGQGGMAVVFAARRVGADFEQLVALKLLRRGIFSPLEQNLFRRERQLLANCNHPNIARLIDGGVTSAGIPYLVMEYIDGIRLDAFVAENRLSIRDRLRLFMRVAHGVEAAHRALIVHRDIKPSNVLVTIDGTPKLLDFGVAKLLDEDATHQTLTTALTPSYAAPEQLRGEQITTSVDVYALGVILHELLTGERPSGADADAPSTLLSRTRTLPDGAPPLPPAQLRRVLRGDLDNIVQRALQRRPDRRYPSVTALIDDIDRYLDGRPVSAHPPSRAYILHKFLRRNRTAVAVAGGLLLAVCTSVVGVLWQAQETRAEALRANSVRDLLVDIFRTAEQNRPAGDKLKPEHVVEHGMERILADAALPEESRLELLGVLATVAASMGAYAQMDALTVAGMDAAERLHHPSDERWIDARRLRAESLHQLGRPGEAAALLEPFQATWLALDRRAAYEALIVLATTRQASAKSGDAEANAGLLAQLRRNAEASSAISDELVFNIMISEADQLSASHRFKEALERGEAADRYWREQGLHPTSKMIWLHGAIGNAASSLGDSARGEAAYREAIDLSRRIHAGPHWDTAWFTGLLGSYLVALGRTEEAEPYVLEGLQMRRQVTGEASEQTLFAINALGRLRAAQDRSTDALDAFGDGISICEMQQLEIDACAGLRQARGRLRLQQGDVDQAKADLEAGAALQTRVSGAESPKIASFYAYLAEVHRRQGLHADAIATAERALAIMHRSGGGHWANIAIARLQRAWSNLHLGNAQAAYDEMADEEPRFAAAADRNIKMRATMNAVAALALQRLDRTEEAKALADTALALDPSSTKIRPRTRTALLAISDGERPSVESLQE